MTAKPILSARLAEIDTESRLALDAAKGARHSTIELLAEIHRLSADLHLAARLTDEPCPLCISLEGYSEVCALHHEIDEARFAAQRHAKRVAALEVEVGETKLVIEQQDRDLERQKERIAALEAGLREFRQQIDDACNDSGWWYMSRIDDILKGAT